MLNGFNISLKILTSERGITREKCDARTGDPPTVVYVILPRSDLKGIGSAALMELIIDWGKPKKLQRVPSQILAENAPMLALCRDLGIEIAFDPDNVSVRHVALDLAMKAGTGHQYERG